MRIGYGRVSSRSPPADDQQEALRAAGCAEVFIDIAFAKHDRRTALERALRTANHPGDQLVITTLDRLGRSLEHLTGLADELEDRGVDLVVLDPGIDTSTAAGRTFFEILRALAEFEHVLMSERTIDGLAAARARGRTGGPKPKLDPREARLARQMYAEVDSNGKRRYTVEQIAEQFGVSRPTIYRHISRSDDRVGGPGQ